MERLAYPNATEPLWQSRLLVLQSTGNWHPIYRPQKNEGLVDPVTLLIGLTVLLDEFTLGTLRGVFSLEMS